MLLICICASAWAQKKKSTASKTTTTLSKAEKMGYARTNKYWGPGTYYCYAPGKPNNKMAVNAETDMRDLTGISTNDFYNEVAKQGFIEVPKKETKAWFKGSKSNDVKFYYSPDKSYILQPGICEMYNSPKTETGQPALAISNVIRYVLIPEKDSTKVIDAIWQYLRDLKETDVILSTFSSDFKKAELKVYPIQRAGSSGWTGMRAGSFVLKMVDGKPKGYWENNETIIHRTIGMPQFKLVVLGMETDFVYMLQVKLQKEGYVLSYSVGAITIGNLEPSNTWIKEYPHDIEVYQTGLKGDKAAVDLYKKSPLPPVLLSMDKLLHR